MIPEWNSCEIPGWSNGPRSSDILYAITELGTASPMERSIRPDSGTGLASPYPTVNARAPKARTHDRPGRLGRQLAPLTATAGKRTIQTNPAPNVSLVIPPPFIGDLNTLFFYHGLGRWEITFELPLITSHKISWLS